MEPSPAPSSPWPTPRRPAGTGALVLLAVIAGVWALSAAKAFLVPLVLAVFALILVNALDRVWRRIPVGGRRLPTAVVTPISVAVIVSVGVAVALLIADNSARIVQESPRYQARFLELYEGATAWLDLDSPDPIERYLESINVGALAGRVLTGVGGVLGNAALVFVYLFFLLAERRFFLTKLENMASDPKDRATIAGILDQIDHDVTRYIGIKTVVSLLTAAPALAVMAWVGLDFAPVWAVLIFLLNFIPNIGSLVATALPALMALLQFETFWPFVIVAAGLTVIQLIVANLVEPPLMGRTLNMSPLVVIISLVLWSLIWGLAGAFLCVPMTAVVLIVLSKFPSTRWMAVLLSRSGRIGPMTPTSAPS